MPTCAECKAPICWTEKTKLEKILIVSIIFISALALAVLCAYLATILVGKEKNKEKETKSSKDNICLTESCIFSAATILDNLDPKISPCEDFYNFACGNFIKKTIVPDDQEYENTFSTGGNSLKKQFKLLFEEPVQVNELKPFQMLKKFYKICMNEDSIEKEGLNTIRSILKDLGGWPVLEGDKWAESKFDWKELTFEFRKIGFWDESLFLILVLKHHAHSNQRVLHIMEPPGNRKIRMHQRVWTEEEVKKAYFRYMVDAAVQFGADRNRSESELRDAFIFDGKISDLSKQTFGNLTDINLANLQQTFPNFTWMGFINKLLASYITVSDNEKLLVNLVYLRGLESLLQTVDKRTLANYMIWRFVCYCAPFLNRQLIEAELKFIQVYTGVTSIEERWKYCLEAYTYASKADSIRRESLFIAAGALYVRKHFSKKEKEYAQEMISNIYRTFQDTLEHTDWMDGATKKKALDKAKAIIMNTAYPDEFLDDKKLLQFYDDDIELNENNHLKSILKLNLFDIRHHIKRLREPAYRKNWIYDGHVITVNAFYDPQSNSIHVPVGILQNRTFNNRRPNYLNYGAIGTVIGHEFTHGFDNVGRTYDKNGNLIQWWTPESNNVFNNKSACIVKQYNNYILPELNMRVNGNLTLTENIADNGGWATSYKAYKEWVKKNGEEKMLPGLKYTQNQLFWLSLANFWCSKETPEFRQYLLSNPHSPTRFRVIGCLSNYKDFSNDFHCSVGSGMNPKQKCKLW